MYSFHESLFQVPAILIVAIFFTIIFLLNWLGYRVRKRLERKHTGKEITIGTAEGSLLGLMALLLAFSFGMAGTKFETRRQAIIDEANILTDAILRCDLYPDSVKRSLLPHFRQYLEARIQYFEAGDNPGKIKVSLHDAHKNFEIIWKQAILLERIDAMRWRTEKMVPALLSMHNIVTTREAGRVAAVPMLIIIVLHMLVFVAAFLSGFGIKPGHRNLFLSMAFAFMTSAVLYLVMELGRPRQGYINLENANRKIVELRELFH